MKRLRAGWMDSLFAVVLLWFALCIAAVAALFVYELCAQAAMALSRFGPGLFAGSSWRPLQGHFGALPLLYGTAVSATVGMALGAVGGVSAALFLTQYTRFPLVNSLGSLVDLLAVIPGVVYGLWGLLVLAPWLRGAVEPALGRLFGFVPWLRGRPHGADLLAAGLVLGVMVLPTVTAVAKSVMNAIPSNLREGALALGATRFEMVRLIVLPGARVGIVGSVVLAFSRAVGEAVAVALVIGHRAQIGWSLFAPGETMASAIVRDFSPGAGRLYTGALYEIALLLLLVTSATYAVGRLLVWRVAKQAEVWP